MTFINKLIFLLIVLVILLFFNKNIVNSQKFEAFENKNKLKCIYMWGMKPDEKNSCPMELVNKNKKYFNYEIIGRNEIEILVDKYPNPKLKKIWNDIPKWIIQADLGRLLYVYYYGNFYFDIDCEIFKDFSKSIKKNTILFIEHENINPDVLGEREDKNMTTRIANYAFGSTIKENPFFRECIELCIKRLEIFKNEGKNKNNISDTDVIWVCGPDVITTVYYNFKKDNIQLFKNDYLRNKNFGTWR